MPKKFSTENTKAAAARDRKKAAKDAESSKKKQEQEEAYWQDNDKHAKKKQQRKQEQDEKREQIVAKKAEVKLLLEQETTILKSGKVNQSSKLTRAQINTTLSSKQETNKKKEQTTHLDEPLVENINRIETGENAHTIDEAIEILTLNDNVTDKHPERRQKAAYTLFETRRLNELKAENSTLRLSQLKQIIFKEWSKSSENPFNQQ